jgi:hypothetical protein
MATCDYCGSTILFGGVRDGNLRYCKDNCRNAGALVRLSGQIPEYEIDRQVREVHQGLCPVCRGSGPVDVHTAHQVWSALVLTSWKSQPRISCRSCGIKSQVQGLLISLIAGWWGFPWGLIMTPVQVVKNLAGIVKGPDPMTPSPKLERLVRMSIARSAVQQGS